MNLFEKLLKISDEIGYVPKSLTIEMGGGRKYQAVGELDVIKSIKPIEVANRVFSYPVSHKVLESKEIEKKSGSIDQFIRVEVVYRFVDIDKPDDFIEVTAIGDGVDSQDKASGKAQTYADKYALLKAYKVFTGEDTDNEASKDDYKKRYGKPSFPVGLTAKIIAVKEGLGNDEEKFQAYLTHFKTTEETITEKIADSMLTRIEEKKKNA